jgi:hypothetical protein
MLMMQNMMTMMMNNPDMQEMMASQMQEMVSNPLFVAGQTGVAPAQPANFGKVPDKPPAVVSLAEPKQFSTLQPESFKPPTIAGRSEITGYADGRPSATKKPVEKMSRAIDDMFQDEAEDLDDFYHRYSRSPKANRLIEESVMNKASFGHEGRDNLPKNKHETDYHHSKTVGYHGGRPSKPERYESYRPSSTLIDQDELLGTGKPSVLLQGESEMVPFRDSHDFLNNESGKKLSHYADIKDDRGFDPRDKHRSVTSDFDRPSYDRLAESKYDDHSRHNYSEETGERYSRFRGNQRDQVNYEGGEPSESLRGQGRNIRRHNNYFMDKETSEGHQGINNHVSGFDDKPIRRRYETDPGLGPIQEYSPDNYDARDSDHYATKDNRFDSHGQTEDQNIKKTKTYVNPYDDIPVGASKNQKQPPAFKEATQGSADKSKKSPVNFDDIPIKGANKTSFESQPEHQGSTDGGRDSNRGREQGSNRGSPFPINPARRSGDYEGQDDDDEYGRPPAYSQSLNEHESKQIKGTHKDFMQLLEEQLALDGKGSDKFT